MSTDSILYRSAWGSFAYCTILFTALFCFGIAFWDFSIAGAIISGLCFLCILIPFFGIYYKISGDLLIVYYCFYPVKYPIKKIKSIKPIKTILSAPAVSLSKRIAVTFTDRSVLKSNDPLVISPAKRTEFLKQLLSINPDIEIDNLLPDK